LVTISTQVNKHDCMDLSYFRCYRTVGRGFCFRFL